MGRIIGVVGTRTLISVAEFDRLEVPEDKRYELDDGELLVMTKPRYGHNRIVMRLTQALLAYLENHPIGEVLTADNLFVLGPGTKRIPDLSFLSAARVALIEDDEDIHGAPELAIEVLSPSDTVAMMRRKVREYFTAGGKLVWLVYPESKEVEVWESPKGPTEILGVEQTLAAPAVLPGFSILVKSLF